MNSDEKWIIFLYPKPYHLLPLSLILFFLPPPNVLPMMLEPDFYNSALILVVATIPHSPKPTRYEYRRKMTNLSLSKTISPTTSFAHPLLLPPTKCAADDAWTGFLQFCSDSGCSRHFPIIPCAFGFSFTLSNCVIRLPSLVQCSLHTITKCSVTWRPSFIHVQQEP